MNHHIANPFTPSDKASRSVDVMEFAWLNSSEELTQVFHYRTIYTEEGHLQRDVLSWQQRVGGIGEGFSAPLES